MGSLLGVGEFTTHFRTYSSGWGYASASDFDPWPPLSAPSRRRRAPRSWQRSCKVRLRPCRRRLVFRFSSRRFRFGGVFGGGARDSIRLVSEVSGFFRVSGFPGFRVSEFPPFGVLMLRMWTPDEPTPVSSMGWALQSDFRLDPGRHPSLFLNWGSRIRAQHSGKYFPFD